MDMWALNVKGGGGVSVFRAMRIHETVGLVALRLASPCRTVGVGERVSPIGFEVSISARRIPRPETGYRSVVVRAGGKKDSHGNYSGKDDHLLPEEDDHDRDIQDKPAFNESTKKPHHPFSDWRDFRANLVAQEQEQLRHSDAHPKDSAKLKSSHNFSPKWAHPIPMPETGCVLVATEKLDGVPSFERTVILLLRLGSRDPREGPFGIILNRPLNRKIKNMKLSNPELANIFADCSVHFGGPLEANMFLLRTGDNLSHPGFGEVVSGVCFGARNSLDEAAALVKKGVFSPQDFRFFLGYAGWQFDQLLDEIGSDYWVVAACSSHLINGAAEYSSSNLWEEILQLMGGRYSDLSRKPKQDDS